MAGTGTGGCDRIMKINQVNPTTPTLWWKLCSNVQKQQTPMWLISGACSATGIGALGPQLKILKTMQVLEVTFGSGSYVLLEGKANSSVLKLSPSAKHRIHNITPLALKPFVTGHLAAAPCGTAPDCWPAAPPLQLNPWLNRSALSFLPMLVARRAKSSRQGQTGVCLLILRENGESYLHKVGSRWHVPSHVPGEQGIKSRPWGIISSWKKYRFLVV